MVIDKYTLDQLIEKLGNIKHGLEDKLNFPKAIYSLAIEIRDLKKRLALEGKEPEK